MGVIRESLVWFRRSHVAFFQQPAGSRSKAPRARTGVPRWG